MSTRTKIGLLSPTSLAFFKNEKGLVCVAKWSRRRGDHGKLSIPYPSRRAQLTVWSHSRIQEAVLSPRRRCTAGPEQKSERACAQPWTELRNRCGRLARGEGLRLRGPHTFDPVPGVAATSNTHHHNTLTMFSIETLGQTRFHAMGGSFQVLRPRYSGDGL